MSQPKHLSRDLSIDFLRTPLTLLVIAHHSTLAYTTFAHFDPMHVFQSTAPVVDNARWRFLDYAENFNDVFFMSLMFFVSAIDGGERRASSCTPRCGVTVPWHSSGTVC